MRASAAEPAGPVRNRSSRDTPSPRLRRERLPNAAVDRSVAISKLWTRGLAARNPQGARQQAGRSHREPRVSGGCGAEPHREPHVRGRGVCGAPLGTNRRAHRAARRCRNFGIATHCRSSSRRRPRRTHRPARGSRRLARRPCTRSSRLRQGPPGGIPTDVAVEGHHRVDGAACKIGRDDDVSPMQTGRNTSSRTIHIASSTPWQRLERRAGGSRARDGVGAV